MLRALFNWLRGIDPLEEETERILALRGTMSASKWLELAEPHYDRLVARLEEDDLWRAAQ